MHSSFGNQASGKCYSGSSFSFGGVKRDDDKNKEPWSAQPVAQILRQPGVVWRASDAREQRELLAHLAPVDAKRDDTGEVGLPGPGQYNKTEPGEAYSEMTRFGKKSIAQGVGGLGGECWAG